MFCKKSELGEVSIQKGYYGRKCRSKDERGKFFSGESDLQKGEHKMVYIVSILLLCTSINPGLS